MTIHYSIDSLARNGERLFGWGWILSERAATERVDLHVPAEDGSEVILTGLRTGMRDDLAAVFPTIPHAAAAGFLILGRIPHPAVDRLAYLVAYLDDGSREVRELPGFPGDYLHKPLERTLQARWHSAIRSLRREGMAAFCRRAIERIAGNVGDWWRHIDRPLLAPPSSTRPVVVLDHAMGGGANRFRDEWVARCTADRRVVYVVSPVIARLAYQIERRGAGHARVKEYSHLAEALDALDALGGCDVAINDLVSFDDPHSVIHWAHAQKSKGGRLTFFLHDYFAVCPSWTLVDDTGRYCGLPSPDRCRQCLARNAVPFHSFYQCDSITEWRASWRNLLVECDEIVAFSRASAEILVKAHPEIHPERIEIRPHRVDYLPAAAKARPALTLPMVIGILGHVSAHKGATVLRDVIQEVRESGAPIRFKVFGSVDNMSPSEYLDVLGPYKTEQLPSLIEAHGVGICFLPSVCPETFSYVTSEIIHLGMPLAVFDLGAPAERARSYDLGRVLTSMEPAAVVHQLLEFGEDLRSRQKYSPNDPFPGRILT